MYCMRHIQAACISQITKQSLATASPLVSLSPPHLVQCFCHAHEILQKQDPEGIARVHELGLYPFSMVLDEVCSQEPSGKSVCARCDPITGGSDRAGLTPLRTLRVCPVEGMGCTHAPGTKPARNIRLFYQMMLARIV